MNQMVEVYLSAIGKRKKKDLGFTSLSLAKIGSFDAGRVWKILAYSETVTFFQRYPQKDILPTLNLIFDIMLFTRFYPLKKS